MVNYFHQKKDKETLKKNQAKNWDNIIEWIKYFSNDKIKITCIHINKIKKKIKIITLYQKFIFIK